MRIVRRAVTLLTVAVAVVLVTVAVFPGPVSETLTRAGVSLPGPVAVVLEPLGVSVPDPTAAWVAVRTRPDGSPARFETCKPIRWTFNPDGAPRDGRAVMEDAFAEVSRLTGWEFVYAGTDRTLPQPGWEASGSGARFEPVRVVWASPRSTDFLDGTETARTSATYASGRNGLRIVGGTIVFNIDTAAELPRGRERANHLGAVAVHEIGHVLGLGHVSDPGSLLHGGYKDWPFRYSDGDLAGFAAVGSPCR